MTKTKKNVAVRRNLPKVQINWQIVETRRRELGVPLARLATTIQQMSGTSHAISTQLLYAWKQRGYFPSDYVKALALALEVPLEELTAVNTAFTAAFIPRELLQAMGASNRDAFSLAEITWLGNLQAELSKPLTPPDIDRLFTLR